MYVVQVHNTSNTCMSIDSRIILNWFSIIAVSQRIKTKINYIAKALRIERNAARGEELSPI